MKVDFKTKNNFIFISIFLIFLSFSFLSLAFAFVPSDAKYFIPKTVQSDTNTNLQKSDDPGTSVLRQTIYSPFGTIIHSDGQAGNVKTARTSDRTPSYTTVASRFMDFHIYTSSNKRNEPYCKVGGQYIANIYLDARGPNKGDPDPILYDANKNLYYCKTTEDILNKITIPSTWIDSNLLVYCNDGGTVSYPKTNFDYMTSRANTYKSCIVKNLDLESRNTVIYGYDVGNKFVDSAPANFYDFQTKMGPIVQGLEIDTETAAITDSTHSVEEWVGEITIPFKETTVEYVVYDKEGMPIDKSYSDWVPMSHSEALAYAQSIDPQITNIELITHSGVYELHKLSGGNGPFGRARGGGETIICTSNSVSYYYKMYTNDYDSGALVYKDKLGNPYYLSYDTYEKFYSLKGFSEDLSLKLTDIFDIPNDFDISRVALFKKINGKYIYGYEGAVRQKTGLSEFDDSIKPEYTIKLESGYPGFSKKDCENTLAPFKQSNSGTLEFNVEVLCESDSVIKIYADNMNKKYNSRAFHLFKNIITSLQ